MQDTTTQAMTELALGLSMAFFSIMILALISMQQPMLEMNKQSTHKNSSTLYIENTIDISSTNLKKITSKKAIPKNKTNQEQLVFYFKEKFVQQSLLTITIEQLDFTRPLIVAVEPNMGFSDVVRLKNSINHPMLSITTINNEWLLELQQKQLEIVE
ncbi:MAG: hypothetical protein OCD76_25615 [Reichenbachiella sp.]